MAAPKMIRGFDYTAGVEVVKSSTEWNRLKEQAARHDRVGGDMALFNEQGRITHEYYDKD